MLPKESGFNQSEKFAFLSSRRHNLLNGMSTCGCNNNAIFSDKAIFTFPTVDVCLPLSIGRGKALAVPAKVARWQHCLIHYFS